MVLYFDQSDKISNDRRIKYTLTNVKRSISLTRHGIQLKHPERLQWKDLRLNIICNGTDQMFQNIVNQLKLKIHHCSVDSLLPLYIKLIANFRESAMFNELTYFRRFGEKTQMTLHFFMDVNRVMSSATESSGRFRAVWERFTSDMEREGRNTSPEIGISTNGKKSEVSSSSAF
ncbi:hypothetical protein FGIG_07439 [Fasciola gigantica]|uniref:Uncharacterized protein n=1 Tax=Fasciola gigantica TaxID=46835 RepID=A0A504YF60_FASGI|nr:hypothetical protein FGIG_07439 [Fasciola gigantica]